MVTGIPSSIFFSIAFTVVTVATPCIKQGSQSGILMDRGVHD